MNHEKQTIARSEILRAIAQIERLLPVLDLEEWERGVMDLNVQTVRIYARIARHRQGKFARLEARVFVMAARIERGQEVTMSGVDRLKSALADLERKQAEDHESVAALKWPTTILRMIPTIAAVAPLDGIAAPIPFHLLKRGK